jgi:hypothetical protein
LSPCRRQCAFKRTRQVNVVDELPKTTGKIRRFKLRDSLGAGQWRNAITLILTRSLRGHRVGPAMDATPRHDPVVAHDSPGFASSRLGPDLGLEVIRMVEQGSHRSTTSASA